MTGGGSAGAWMVAVASLVVLSSLVATLFVGGCVGASESRPWNEAGTASRCRLDLVSPSGKSSVGKSAGHIEPNLSGLEAFLH